MATGFSPSSLIFNLEPGEEECQKITFSSESSTISVSDSWALNKDVEWKVSLFNTSSGEHALSLTYPREVDGDAGKVDVCLIGSEEGEYQGILILTEEQEGTSIIQMGIWLKAVISKNTTPVTPSADTSSSSGGGGGGGGGATTTQTTSNSQETQDNEVTETIGENSGITGKAIQESSNTSKLGLIIGVAIIAIILVIIIYKRRKK